MRRIEEFRVFIAKGALKLMGINIEGSEIVACRAR
jgi:hypothetical protein